MASGTRGNNNRHSVHEFGIQMETAKKGLRFHLREHCMGKSKQTIRKGIIRAPTATCHATGTQMQHMVSEKMNKYRQVAPAGANTNGYDFDACNLGEQGVCCVRKRGPDRSL